MTGVFLLTLPIFGLDTDLWFHLSGGKYVVEHLALPRTSYFSFLEPPQEWVDYAWGFQVLVYGIYTWWGYYGVIVLRAALCLVTFTLICRYLIRAGGSSASGGWTAFLAVLYALVLVPRYASVRPHIATYLLLVVFLVVLEQAHRRAWLLPALGVLWANLHGVMYPVILGVVGAYLIERLLASRVPSATRRSQAEPLWSLIVTPASVLLTPHGLRLLDLPFLSIGSITPLVAELHPLTWRNLTTFHIVGLAPSAWTLISVLFGVSVLSVVVSVASRRARLSHLLLWILGVFLLTMSRRFVLEYLLLSLPMVAAAPLLTRRALSSRRLVRLGMVLIAALGVVMPVRFLDALRHSYGDPAPLPFSRQRLPEGSVAFLRHVDAGGKVLNHPDSGGYLRWRLHPRYQIFIDVEAPFLFRAEHLMLGDSMFRDPQQLRLLLARYEPEFITIPMKSLHVVDVLAGFPDYTPVFMDDVEVLYLNRRHHPALVSAFSLGGLDLPALHSNPDLTIRQADLGRLKPAIERLIAIDPACEITRYLAGLIALREGRDDAARSHAEAIIRHVPTSVRGYRLLGDAWQRANEPEGAAEAYRAARKEAARRERF